MAAPAREKLAGQESSPEHKPYIPDDVVVPEFTWPAVLVGAFLGIIFGASSLYLLLKVGMTVSASVPIAVLSITLFRAFSKVFGFRRATVLENNIVQTTGSAGESIAFGVGVTMPALLLLGFEMHWVRVMTISVLGGLLGILMMIPLRRAFIVKQHGKLKYPEGTACAEVLVAGERGGSSAQMVFIGFGIAFVHKLLAAAFQLWPGEPSQNLFSVDKAGNKVGLKGAAISGDLSPEMMGVGYLIGPRIACLMMAGAVLSFFVIGPLIATFGESLTQVVKPAESVIDEKTGQDKGLIRNMGPNDIYKWYLRYIGAGAVAAGGIISMCRALPLIISSIVSGLRDLRSTAAGGISAARTERDLPMSVVAFGSLALVIVLAAVPQLGLGLSLEGVLGAIMILLFGFLFVTVSSRLTGEVGSSSNPISGMTIATLLLTCLIFVLVGRRDTSAMLTALSVAGVVCIASSNGGTTSQDLKTGYLVGATPKSQQYAILIGTLTSAVVIGGTMLALNIGGTHYTKKGFANVKITVPADAPQQNVGQPYAGEDGKEYRKVYLDEGRYAGVPKGWYLADDEGRLTYKIDVPIKREAALMDNGKKAPEPFKAPQPQLFALIIEGILGGKLEWALVAGGALIAVALELMAVSALPVAVGMYLGLGTATPIFFGGLLRWATDRMRGVSASEAETETSPGVLLSSGYIAGGTLCGLLWGFLVMAASVGFLGLPTDLRDRANLGEHFSKGWEDMPEAKIIAVAAFGVLALILLLIGGRRTPAETAELGEPGP
ncbi:MAG TPA: oligopeptide transporter, OPT family [Gemmataceae bacterium]|jgi:putative OPT family oligopeptide transporter|nr:oligopeptide transporter, OPT family [Gemmataceae bacterium]